ncbi:MAG: gamma-glutamyltransferase, partial [Vicinamibacterales bacterium]|nr:gamma-glutamyltransferase [Vicinamibacterales bacterium]
MAALIKRLPCRRSLAAAVAVLVAITPVLLIGSTQPIRARQAMVVSQDDIASRVGVEVMRDGGNAIDAAVATALALAVTYPTAGNIGGGGFLIYRPVEGPPVAYDFRETAPGGSFPAMFMKDGEYDPVVHHNSHFAVGVPGTVAGLHLAWSEHGALPWRRLVEPAVALAGDGFPMS